MVHLALVNWSSATGLTVASACFSCISSVNSGNPAAVTSVAGVYSSLCGGGSQSGEASAPTPTPTATGNPGSCDTNPACQSFSSSVASCSLADETCQCSIVLEYGSACSVCYATVDPNAAAAYSALLSGCGGGTVAGSGVTATANAGTTGGNVQATTGTAAKVASTGSPSPNTSKSTSGASQYDGFLGFSPVFMISFLLFMGSVVTLLFG
jgi:hypothetical protein